MGMKLRQYLRLVCSTGCSEDEISSQESPDVADQFEAVDSWGEQVGCNLDSVERLKDLCDEVDWNMQISHEPLKNWMTMTK